MKRDMDLIRRILLEIEGKPYTRGTFDLQVGGHTSDEVQYHLALLAEAGLINATSTVRERFEQCHPRRLTWEGHEFLEAAKDEGRWERAKEAVVEKAGGLTFAVLAAVLKRMVTEAVMGGVSE